MPKRKKRRKCSNIRVSYLFCLLLALVVLTVSSGTAEAAGNPFPNATIRYNVSKTKVNSSSLPSGSSSFNQNDRVYFNTTLRNIKITKTELYVTPPGDRQTLVETDKHSYTNYIWMAGSGSGYTLNKTGTYSYVLRLYSGNYSKNYSGSFTVSPPNPFPSATIRYNVSKSKANSSSLPSGSTSFSQNDRVYFNATLRNIKITKTELYVTPPGGKQTLVETDSSSYSSYIWMAGSGSGYSLNKTGTYKYVLRLYSGNYSKDYSGSLTVSPPNPFPSATIRYNVSKSKVNSSSLPSGSTSFSQNDRVYFNATLRNIKITKTKLYVTPPGGKQTLVETDNSSYSNYIWMAGSGSGYTLNKTGTYKYVLRLYSGNYSKDYSGSISSVANSSTPVSTVTVISNSEINRAATENSLSGTQKNALNRINTQYASKLTAKERKGTLIFMFEGCGNDSGVYKGLDGKVKDGKSRANAMCVVVKNNRVVFVSKYSSSLPSTYDESENDGKNVPTLLSGMYKFSYKDYSSSLGHHFRLKTMSGSTDLPVLRYNREKQVFYSSTSNGIYIHSKGYGTGCQLVSSYSSFLGQVGTTGSSGIYIVDRSFARNYLEDIKYTEEAIATLVR